MTHTSSIGPQWPPAPASYHRVKGIDNRGCITEPEQLTRLETYLEELASELRAEGPSRLSLRALVEHRLLQEHRAMLAAWGEAIIPLVGCGERFEAVSLVYWGRNHATRDRHADDLARSLSNVELAERKAPRAAGEMIHRVRGGGYGLRMLSRPERLHHDSLHRAMADLYSRFGWSTDETRQILANPQSLIAVAERDGEVVSAGIAELSLVALGSGDELRMAEFTEAATRVDHQGHGLYSGIVALLSRELAQRSRRGEILGGELNVAFGECSGHDLGVLIAAKHLARTFSRKYCQEQGLPVDGYLCQHVPIAGAPRSTDYNDLFPTYLSRADLYSFADG